MRPNGLICEVVDLGFGPQLKSLCSFTQRWLLYTSRDSNIAFSCKNFQDINTFFPPKIEGFPWQSSGCDTVLPVQVRSLVRELRFCILSAYTEKVQT